METWKKAILLILVAVIGIFVVPQLFAIVLPGGHIGTITAGTTATINLDTCLFADKDAVSGGSIWFVVKDLDETQTLYTSESKSVTLQPGQCVAYEFTLPGASTSSWDGEYKLIVLAQSSDGLNLPLEGSLFDPRYTAEGGVAWQFTVEGGSQQMTCQQYCQTQQHIQCTGHWSISGTYPNCNCEWICDEPDIDWALIIVVAVVILVLFSVIIIYLIKRR